MGKVGHVFRPMLLTVVVVSSLPSFSSAFVQQVPSLFPYLSWSSSRTKGTVLDATWSNGQAIKEYQDFLSSGKSTMDTTEDGASVIIASSPSHPLAAAMLRMGKGDDIVVAPGDPIPAVVGGRSEFPVYVCLSPCELKAHLSAHLFSAWDDKRDDLVFLSPLKGNIEPLLQTFGLPRDATSQLLVSFTTPPSNFRPMDTSCGLGLDAQGSDKFAFESAACGKWKDAVAARLHDNDIRCKTGFYREWRRFMWERSVFDAVFHLVGVCANIQTQDSEGDGDSTDDSSNSNNNSNSPNTLADVAKFYGDDASDMAWQMSSMLRGSNAIALTYGFEERMFVYAETKCQDVPCSIEHDTWDHVNAVFLRTSLKGLSMGFGDPAPTHTEYARFAKEHGLLDFGGGTTEVEIPEYDGVEQRLSIMREGNLRADGVI